MLKVRQYVTCFKYPSKNLIFVKRALWTFFNFSRISVRILRGVVLKVKYPQKNKALHILNEALK